MENQLKTDQFKTIDQVLRELFKQSPIPNKLKTPKRKFEKGILGNGSKIRIVEDYTPFEVFIHCQIVPDEDPLI